MAADPTVQLIDKKGKRVNGRRDDEVRPIKITAGVLHRADGSAYLEWGNNKVLCGVYGPREFNPRRFQKADKAVVRCKYNMAAFSVSDRKRPGPDRRSQEIGRVIANAFENVVLTEKYPRGVIDINMEILQADAGTRIAALAAAAVALADAGVPMKGMIAGCAAGKAGGKIVVDLDQLEDNFGEADVPVAVNMTTGEIVLLQMDGHLSPEEFDTAIDMATKACEQVYQAQREALLERFHGALDQMEEEFQGREEEPEQERGRGDSGRGGGRGGPRGGGGRGGDRGGRGGDRGGRGGDRGGDRGGRSGGDGGRGRSGGRESDKGGRGRSGGRRKEVA